MKNILALLSVCLILSACTDNLSEEGLHAEISLTNQKSKPGTIDTGEGSTKQFVRNLDGKQFQLQTGLLNLLPIELMPCGLLAGLRPMEGLLANAYAHGSDEVAPGGVLDVSQADGTELELGELLLTPGSYCGMRVALVPVISSAAPEPDAIDMNGSSLYTNVCYYYQSGTGGNTTAHYCFALKVAGASENHVISFDAPVTVDAVQRQGQVRVVVHYDQWFDRLSADDAFTALDGYASVAANPPCGTPVVDVPACTTAKNNFKAGLQENTALKNLLTGNVLGSLKLAVQ